MRSKICFRLITLFCLGLLYSCEKSDDFQYDEPERFFSEFYPNYIEDSIAIAFTGYFSENPEVFINQKRYEGLTTNNGHWNFTRIPYSKVIDYEISVGDNLISGTYNVPDELFGKIFCNGVELLNNETNYLVKSESYLFTWEKLDCDYYSLVIQDTGERSFHTTDTVFVINNYDPNDFNLTLIFDYIDETIMIEEDRWEGELFSYFYKQRYIEFIK